MRSQGDHSQRDQHRPEPERRDRLIQERVHDPYEARLKMADPAVCPQCGAVYENGRWRWGLRPVTAEETVCQACRRIADHCPAGILTLGGAVVQAHRDEVMAIIQHQHEQERAEHPLNRIMGIRDTEDGGMEVTTTDLHLPRRIGEALHHAHHGDLTMHYDEGECFTRVHWRAD